MRRGTTGLAFALIVALAASVGVLVVAPADASAQQVEQPSYGQGPGAVQVQSRQPQPPVVALPRTGGGLIDDREFSWDVLAMLGASASILALVCASAIRGRRGRVHAPGR